MKILTQLHSRRAFTLVEVLMTLMLAAILGAVATVQFMNYSKEAKIAVTKQRLVDLAKAISGDSGLIANGVFLKPGFEHDIGALPTSLNDLINQGTYPSYNPYTKLGWRGPYVNSSQADWNKDAWGTALVYSAGARTIKSYGPDTLLGNGDDITQSF